MLGTISTGLHPSAIVSHLAEKYCVSDRVLKIDGRQRALSTLTQ